MSSMDAYPTQLASGFNDEGQTRPFELFAGEAPIVTNNYIAGQDLPMGAIVILDGSSTVRYWNGTDFPGNEAATVVNVPMGIVAVAALEDDNVAVYEAGFFNFAALKKTGNAAVTLDDAKRAFQGTDIHVGMLKGSNDRMTLPSL